MWEVRDVNCTNGSTTTGQSGQCQGPSAWLRGLVGLFLNNSTSRSGPSFHLQTVQVPSFRNVRTFKQWNEFMDARYDNKGTG